MKQQKQPGSRQNKQGVSRDVYPFELSSIQLSKPPVGLFSQIAEEAVKFAAEWKDGSAGGNASKPTQLRKFYDEICMWDNRIQAHPEDFEKHLPFILMLKAKVAYSKGRKHINSQYYNLLNHCLTQLEKTQKKETLHNLKLFMEAFTGFYKVYGPAN